LKVALVSKTRRSVEATWDLLQSLGHEPPRDSDGKPFVLNRMPRYDDRELRLSYFRCGLSDVALCNLTLPRTFFGRSSFEGVAFSNSNISESRMCWNDFVECDFSGADLSCCDLRASLFDRCIFRGVNLSGADLRRSEFARCVFTDAVLNDAKLTRFEGFALGLSTSKKSTICWQWFAGELPGGG